jgi:ankyrin repeat protein
MHAAVSENNVEIVKKLLDKGADHDAVNHAGATPMTRAFYNNRWEIVRVILETKYPDYQFRVDVIKDASELKKIISSDIFKSDFFFWNISHRRGRFHH